MKAAIVLLVAAFGLAVASEFSEYVAKHNKAYATNPTEFARREAIYTRNAEEIRRKRADMEAAGEEPWMGINEFTDMTVEEFAQSGRLMPRKLNADDARSCLAHGVTADYSGLDMSALPTDFDWREKGVVNPIQNQGQCGSCWTFSTIASIESAYAIKTGKLQKLAEQEVVDCSKGCVLEEGQQVCNDGCNGGWMWSAMHDIVGWKGEELESNYPYTAETGTCKRKPALTINPISNYTCLSGPNKANETEMAAFLVANGPISMAMDAGILQTYTSGIIKPSAGDCSKTQLDHALVIVGFGTQGSTEFWIVRNSWGESWGEKGYFRIIRGKGACGLNAGVVFPNI